jgi:hypothetical protein
MKFDYEAMENRDRLPWGRMPVDVRNMILEAETRGAIRRWLHNNGEWLADFHPPHQAWVYCIAGWRAPEDRQEPPAPSDTPRTDAATVGNRDSCMVGVRFARQLERELIATAVDWNRIRKERDQWKDRYYTVADSVSASSTSANDLAEQARETRRRLEAVTAERDQLRGWLLGTADFLEASAKFEEEQGHPLTATVTRLTAARLREKAEGKGVT